MDVLVSLTAVGSVDGLDPGTKHYFAVRVAAMNAAASEATATLNPEQYGIGLRMHRLRIA